MIQKIDIQNFKGIKQAELAIKPLTILTGLNSTGKSTCFQTILTLMSNVSLNANTFLSDYDFSFDTLRNRNVNAKEIKISLQDTNNHVSLTLNADGSSELTKNEDFNLDLENNIFYLSANRIGFSDFETISSRCKIGTVGEYIFGTFEEEKSIPVLPKLVKTAESETLSSQLNYWLTYILGIKFEMQTEKVMASKVKVVYKSDGLSNLSPRQLGVGVSYLAKVLIMCLRAHKGDILMIENPEIHLHPAAQARLGEFFAEVVNAGIQLLLETHCEHLINKIRYEVFKGFLKAENVVIYYKGGITAPFEKIEISNDGNFATDFPDGFFDATLDDLLQIE
jgi:predicted ATPase